MKFERWSWLHLLIMTITAVIAYLTLRAGRRASSGFSHKIGFVMAAIQIANTLVYIAFRVGTGAWDARYDLPMEFCNWSLVFSVIALFTFNRTMAEVSYFWVLSGSLQGVITPDLEVGFPHVYFFVFFINHCGLVISALYLVFGLGLHPRKGSILRSLAFLELYVVCTLAVNYALGSNYGYLIRKPASGSLMDYLGPWPYYIVSLQVIAVLVFGIWYLPFRNEGSDVPSRNATAP